MLPIFQACSGLVDGNGELSDAPLPLYTCYSIMQLSIGALGSSRAIDGNILELARAQWELNAYKACALHDI